MKIFITFFLKGIIIIILISGLLQLEYKGKKLDSHFAGVIKTTISFFKANPINETKKVTKETIRDLGKKGTQWLDEKVNENQLAPEKIESKAKEYYENLDELKQNVAKGK